MNRIIGLFVFFMGLAHCLAGLPNSALNLRLTAPVRTWDEAVPLGNGSMGVLLWGETNQLRLSLDRGDLWDERPSPRHLEVHDQFNYATMKRLVAENRMDQFNRIFDSNYDYEGPPSKLPAGRVELIFDADQVVSEFELDPGRAEGIARFGTGQTVRVFVDAANVDEPVAMVLIAGRAPREVRVLAAPSVKKLGYPEAVPGECEGMRWFRQPGVDGFEYAVCAGWQQVPGGSLVALTVSTRAEGKSTVAVARARVEKALKQGYEKRLRAHLAWWAKFWEQSSVTIPEQHILQHYYLVRYFYGAASRRGAPPMPLQGVWTADAGGLPPWKGDYHNDLNTQMTYLAYLGAGHFEEGAAFLDLLWNLLPRFRQFAREFYDAPGAAVPGVMSLAGQPLGGWGQYSLSPTMGAWNAHLFYLHWRYTGDRGFLRDRAYPWSREVGVCLRSLLKPGTNGWLVLPLSSSPEVFDNTRRAFLEPNSNYDLMSLRMLFLSLAEMADALDRKTEATEWREISQRLGPYHTKEDGTLLLDRVTALPGSHRHLSNLIGVHPFNLLTVEGEPEEVRMIGASLKQWEAFGTAAWCGYSFSWMSALQARVGQPEAALRNLDIYTRAFILRNGFHANGDQTRSGFSGFTYRPFTLEGNFLAMQSVQEMLLQSWDHQPGSNNSGVIRVFPAMPWRWHDAAFTDLRAEGGHRVSARRQNNATVWLRVVAGRNGPVKIRDNFGGTQPSWSLQNVEKVGNDFVVNLKRGQVLTATLPIPEEIPPAPANQAMPVVIKSR